MNRKKKIIIIVVLLLVMVAIYYFLFREKKKEQATTAAKDSGENDVNGRLGNGLFNYKDAPVLDGGIYKHADVMGMTKHTTGPAPTPGLFNYKTT